jgi:hypothetical protein
MPRDRNQLDLFNHSRTDIDDYNHSRTDFDDYTKIAVLLAPIVEKYAALPADLRERLKGLLDDVDKTEANEIRSRCWHQRSEKDWKSFIYWLYCERLRRLALHGPAAK